jgi:hypothetical protein
LRAHSLTLISETGLKNSTYKDFCENDLVLIFKTMKNYKQKPVATNFTGRHRKANLFLPLNFIVFIFSFFALFAISLNGLGQTTVSYTGMGSVTCPAVPTATISPAVSGLTFSQLSRGSGVTCATASTGISGSGFNVTLANAISGSKWYTYSITSDASTPFTVSNFSIVSQVSSATGSPSVSVQYKIDAGALTAVGSFTPTTTSTAYTVTPGSAISVGASQTIYIYVIPNNLTAVGTTCRVNNSSSVTVNVSSCTPPTTQATSMTFSSVGTTGMTVGWTRGITPGDAVLTVGKAGSAATDPTNGTTYTGNTIFGSGTACGGGSTVFSASGTSVSVTNLSAETQYFFNAYEYTSATNCFKTPALAGSRYTLSTEPSAHAASFAASAISGSQINLTFSAASTITNADGYIILQKTGSDPTGAPTDATAYSIGNTIGDGTVAAIITSSATTSASITGLSSSTQYNFSLIPFNWNLSVAQTYNYRTAATIPTCNATTTAPAPEINVKQGATSYASGGSAYDFGSVAWGSNSSDITFTIENIGTANLTFSTPLFVSGDYSVITQPTSPVSGPSGTATFTVRFTPTAIGTRAGTITITNNDANEGTYVLNLTGTGTPSNLSDIVNDGTYTPTSNIDYTLWQSATITNAGSGANGSAGVFNIILRDGGVSSPDADNLPTILSAITFTYTGTANTIRSAALFTTSNALIGSSVAAAANSIVFTGLSGANVTATDNGTIELILRVTFTTAVTDNQQLVFTVTNANVTAAGSNTSSLFTGFASASSNTTGDQNRIEVLADRIRFTTQPADQVINTNLASFTIKAVDVNNNTDLDASKSITLTTSGTGMTSGSPYSLTSGILNISDVQFNAIQGPITLTATTTGLSNDNDDVSGNFNITGIIYQANDYQSNTGTGLLWSNASDWRMYNGSGWNAYGADGTPSAIRRVYIQGAMSTNGSRTANEIIIQNAGNLTISASSTATSKMLVKDGGTLTVSAALTNSGTFEVEDNGTVVLQTYTGFNNNSSIWNGTENFHPNSKFIIKEWEANCATTAYRPVFNGTNVTTNTYNSYTAAFGNIDIDLLASTEPNTFVLISSGVTANLAHGNLTFLNPNSIGNNIAVKSTGDVTSGIGGNFIVDDFYAPVQTVMFASSGNLTFTIKGNMQLDGATAVVTTSSTAGTIATVNVDGNINVTPSAVLNLSTTVAGGSPPPVAIINLKGDLTVASSGLLRNSNTSSIGQFNFTGTGDGTTAATTQTIDIASTSANRNKYIAFSTTSGSFVQVINQNFELGTNSTLTVSGGSTFHFGFNGTTALNTILVSGATGTAFTSAQASTLKITSPDGITTGGVGNVQTTTRSYDQVATFCYIGKANQVTGDAITDDYSTAKIIICELADNTIKLSPVQKLLVSNGTTLSTTGGKLDIRKGIFEETTSYYFKSCSGTLYMTDGIYRIKKLSADATDLIPRMIGDKPDDSGAGFPYICTGGTIDLNGGTGDQYLRGLRDYYSLMFSGSGSKWLSDAVTNIGDNSTINTGLVTIKDASTILDVQDWTFSGNAGLTMTDVSLFRMSQKNQTLPELLGTYTMTGGTVELYGTNSTQTHSIRGTDGSSNNITYNNIELNALGENYAASSANVVAQAGFNVNGIMNVNSPVCFQVGSSYVIGGSGSFILKPNASLKYGSANGITPAGTASGNIQTAIRTFPTTSSYGFCGGVDQVTGVGIPNNVKNLYVDKSSNSFKSALSKSFTVDNIVYFEGGKVELGVYNITITNTGISTGTDYIQGYDADKYFITNTVYNDNPKGFLIRDVGSTWETPFPIGIPSTYNPCWVEMWGGHRNFSCRVFPGVYQHGISGNLMENPILNYVNRTWEITPSSTVGITDATVTLQWVGGDEGSNFNHTNAKMIKNIGGSSDNWTDIPVTAWHQLNVSSAPFTIKEGNITTFSKFAVRDNEGSLPVELIDFNAICNDNTINVTWSTASEANNDYFLLERSTDLINWQSIATINGAGNSNSTINYSYSDNNASSGTYYYQLQQFDFDGTPHSYGPIVSYCSGEEIEIITIQPNPATDQISYMVYSSENTEVNIEIVNVLGQVVLSDKFGILKGSTSLNLGLSQLVNGIYYLHIYTATGTGYDSKQLIIQ